VYRPELTAERFIPDPWSTYPGERLYKTGDLARYLEDGTLEFLGRIDQQVKLRGYRIEPGEIETVLCQYPAVREAVVLLREDIPGDQRLVAYVVSESAISQNQVRAYLSARLPAYMLPSAVVALERMPTTPNGKLDRRALPAPTAVRSELEECYVSPRTPIEELIAGTLAEVLGVERVGIYDDFFALGGHSLLAMQLVSRLSHAFPIQIPLRSLFEAPTVARLAEVIEMRLIEKITTFSKDEIQQLSQAPQRGTTW
jgi:acyl carrier protein